MLSKCMSCHEAIVVITGRAHCFYDCIYITLILLCEIWVLCVSWITYDHLYSFKARWWFQSVQLKQRSSSLYWTFRPKSFPNCSKENLFSLKIKSLLSFILSIYQFVVKELSKNSKPAKVALTKHSAYLQLISL